MEKLIKFVDDLEVRSKAIESLMLHYTKKDSDIRFPKISTRVKCYKEISKELNKLIKNDNR